MSLITGYLDQITAQAADGIVTVKAVTMPVIRAGSKLVVPDERSVRARATDGYWEMVLGKGAYEISTKAANGKIAAVTINIEGDDSESYAFDELIISELPNPESPVGGAQPTASASVLGLVKADESVAQPIAVTGLFQTTTVVALRAIVTGSNSKRAWLTAPEARVPKEWWYDVTSLDADDGLTVVKPNGVAGGSPGRWRAW